MKTAFRTVRDFFYFTFPRAMGVVALALAVPALFAQDKGNTPMPTTESPTKALQQMVHTFAQASDRREVPTLEAILHPAFRVVFTTQPGAAPTLLDRAQYLQMMREGKIGGADRTVTVSGVSAGSGFASAAARMVRPDATFHGVYSFIEKDGRWLLLQEAVHMTVLAK